MDLPYCATLPAAKQLFGVRSEPRMLDGVSTKKEKEYVLEEYVSGLEAQGWFLKGPVEAIWAGERDIEKVKAASEVGTPLCFARNRALTTNTCASQVCTSGLERVIETILGQAPSKPVKRYSRSKGLSLRRSVHGVGVSSESTADISAFDVGEGQARTALDLKQMERSTAKNPFFKDLDAEAKSQLFEGMHVEEFSAGDIIIQQGDTDADKFYVIKSGR